MVSTINRTKARLRPRHPRRGIHPALAARRHAQLDRFITPEEFADFIHDSGLEVFERSGMVYNPLADRWSLSRDMAVNYMLAARRQG